MKRERNFALISGAVLATEKNEIFLHEETQTLSLAREEKCRILFVNQMKQNRRSPSIPLLDA